MDATARALEILANQEKLAREHVREAREALSPSWVENTEVLKLSGSRERD